MNGTGDWGRCEVESRGWLNFKSISLCCKICFLSLVSDTDNERFPVWRQKLRKRVERNYFESGIAAVICVNVLFMTMEHYNQPEVGMK